MSAVAPIVIHPARRGETEHGATVSADIERDGARATLWYAVEPEWADYLRADRLDSFVLALLPSAMRLGADLRVEGVMSAQLHYHLNHHYMKVLCGMMADFHPVRVMTDQLDNALGQPRAPGVGAGFSGGVDAFTVMADYFFDNPPPSFRVTHLFNHNVGAHDWPGGDSQTVFRARCDRLRALAAEWGLPLVTINSNLQQVVDLKSGAFPQRELTVTHPTRNVSCVLLLESLVGRYLYGSSGAYWAASLKPWRYPENGAQVFVPMLGTERTQFVYTGSEYTRVAKTARLATVPGATRYLDVCTRRRVGRNCSHCEKCLRTLLTLEILGQLESFAASFDLAIYRHVRNRYIARVFRWNYPFYLEIRRLMRERGFRPPFHLPLAGRLRLWKLLPGNRQFRRADREAGLQ